MTSIERTAYPRFSSKQQFNKQWLFQNFNLNEDDYGVLKRKRAMSQQHKLCMAVQLKVFQYLGYFLNLNNVPGAIIKMVRDCLGYESTVKAVYENDKTKYRHRDHIRNKLGVIKWKDTPDSKTVSTQRLAIEFAHEVSLTMNTTADILNATLEFMRCNNYELPAFSTIDRLVRHVRHIVNTKIFNMVYSRLQQYFLIPKISRLLDYTDTSNRSEYNKLKKLPCSPTITNLNDLASHFEWLLSLGDIKALLEGVSHIKLSQFSEYAASLDVSDIREMNDAKKYALTIMLLNHAQKDTKDALAKTFCKTVFKLHSDAKKELDRLKEQHSKTTQNLAEVLEKITGEVSDYDGIAHQKLIEQIMSHYDTYEGGITKVTEDCKKVAAYNSKNHLPLLWQYLKPKRAGLFRLLTILNIKSATQDNFLIKAMEIIIENRPKLSEHIELEEPLNLSFTTKDFRRLVFDRKGDNICNRKNLETCIFSCLASELSSGDLYIDGTDSFNDYRQQLLPWGECLTSIDDFCKNVDIKNNVSGFIQHLKNKLNGACQRLDIFYPELKNLYIDEEGYPRLKRFIKNNPKSTLLLEEVKRRMPERNLLDIMCNTQQYVRWADVFGPLSGSEPKLKNSQDKYVINTFSVGTRMGPAQTSRHVRADNISVHVLSKINRRHVNINKLNQAMTKLINYANSFSLTHLLGNHSKSGIDGTLRNIFDDNLLAETHYRYRNKGAIAYHHISDTYVALFSTFIPCGVWEAVEIIESLMKNESEMQPHIVHADTQGQSSTVFGLAYLLGIQIMPRIRNFKDLKFYKGDAEITYKNIDGLFDNNVINWELLETHWQDLMQVAMSIQRGTISSSLLLRKLNNNSRQNKLYKAFKELGNVIRTLYLLEYISDETLRDSVTVTTNKVESFNELSDWCSFGSKYIVASNNPMEMEKALKQNTIVANCIIVQNLIDISLIIYNLKSEGWEITKDDVKKLSPYLTEHIKRFGDYIFEMNPVVDIPEEIRELKVA